MCCSTAESARAATSWRPWRSAPRPSRDRPRATGSGRQRQTGVENVLDLLRMGLDGVLMGTGHKSVHELSRADLIIPEGFGNGLTGVAVTNPTAPSPGEEIITMPASAVGVTVDPN